MFSKVLLVVPALCLAAPALAQTDAAAPAPAAKPAKPRKERKICRADAKTSSRIPISTCKTAADWKMHDGAQTDSLIAGNLSH